MTTTFVRSVFTQSFNGDILGQSSTAFLAQVQAGLTDLYSIERELPAGSMSRVFVAIERRLNRRVVVKVLAPELAAGVSAERFAREVKMAAGLQQANIVTVIAVGEVVGLPFYTMPYIDGESLRSMMNKLPVTIERAVSILRDVARALAYAHDRGVVHRDIKPENILLSAGTAMVTDFGIAKAINVSRMLAPAETLTLEGTSLGTPAYMAPEQALGDPTTDHRADIYALGVTAYEILAGRRPFDGGSIHELVRAHLMERPVPLTLIRPDVPASLSELVMQCLEKDPGQRPASAEEMISAIDRPSKARKHGVGKIPAASIEANEYYLRGREFFHQRGRTSIESAREMFRRAIETDPAYALAHAGIAQCSSILYMYFDARESNVKQAASASARAVELDPGLAEAHCARALSYSLGKEYALAMQSFETAMKLDPNLFEAPYFYGRVCLAQGKWVEAEPLFQKAALLRPEDYEAQSFLSAAYTGQGRIHEATRASRKAAGLIETRLRLNPSDTRALSVGATIWSNLGEREKALDWARRSVQLDGEDPQLVYNAACVYALEGMNDDAIHTLMRAIDKGYGHKQWIETDTDLNSLRHDERFQALLGRM